MSDVIECLLEISVIVTTSGLPKSTITVEIVITHNVIMHIFNNASYRASES
jgi:hypothetical protein